MQINKLNGNGLSEGIYIFVAIQFFISDLGFHRNTASPAQTSIRSGAMDHMMLSWGQQ